MADSIIGAVVSTILGNLGSGVYKKMMFAKDLDSHIERLRELQTSVEATLADAALLESCTNAQQDVLDKLKSALADLDDFLDEQADKAELKEVMRGNKLIKTVRLFFSEPNKLVSPIFNNLVVGKDGDRDNVVSMLSEESLSVASIVGIGGMGKTTLAWYVYNDERVERCFDVKFWVQTGPHGIDFMKVLENIIGCVAEELPSNLCDINQLYHHFCRAIGGNKFLLVLDNVWDQDDLRVKWLDFRRLLDFGANGSKVLITTRDQKVAAVMDSDARFMLQDLKEDDSWLLFQKIAFTKWHEPGVEAIGKEIAKMCHKPEACRNLCSLGRLPDLIFLTFDGVDEVEYIEDSGNGNTIDELPRNPLFPSLDLFHAFPKLKQLNVDSLELAIGIARQHLGGFTSLHTLSIHYITCLRHQHRQPLTLLKCCFPKLLKLKYTGINEVEVLPETFRDISSLNHLHIQDCECLTTLLSIFIFITAQIWNHFHINSETSAT